MWQLKNAYTKTEPDSRRVPFFCHFRSRARFASSSALAVCRAPRSMVSCLARVSFWVFPALSAPRAAAFLSPLLSVSTAAPPLLPMAACAVRYPAASGTARARTARPAAAASQKLRARRSARTHPHRSARGRPSPRTAAQGYRQVRCADRILRRTRAPRRPPAYAASPHSHSSASHAAHTRPRR